MGIFKAGIPTGMDVRKLIETFVVEAGTVVTYEQVAAAIGVEERTGRFRTVTTAWRKRVFADKLLRSIAEGGTFRFLTADDAHDLGRRDLKRIGRAAGRLATHVEVIDMATLTGARRDGHNLLRRESAALLDAARRGQKAISAPQPVNTTTVNIIK